ncbi:MAG: RecX family transcriptional regulator [Acidobacteria bacterium]|nr:RecX family transcriptional regulator [Acidobacteriota bacterium]
METQFRAALQYAVRLLGRKVYTELELRRKLEKRFPQSPANEQVIERCRELKFLDDGEYARFFARNRIIERLWGPFRVLFELEQRGVPPSLAQAAVDAVWCETSHDEVMAKAVRKWLKSHGRIRQWKELAGMRNYLLRQGFDSEKIRECLAGFDIEDRNEADER